MSPMAGLGGWSAARMTETVELLAVLAAEAHGQASKAGLIGVATWSADGRLRRREPCCRRSTKLRLRKDQVHVTM